MRLPETIHPRGNAFFSLFKWVGSLTLGRYCRFVIRSSDVPHRWSATHIVAIVIRTALYYAASQEIDRTAHGTHSRPRNTLACDSSYPADTYSPAIRDLPLIWSLFAPIFIITTVVHSIVNMFARVRSRLPEHPFAKKQPQVKDVEKASTPSSGHTERHANNGIFVRDSIIGFADGLTVPFALTAGLSSLGSSKIVILGGLAELFAGSISMGLGAFLAARTDRKHYEVEEKRERQEVKECPAAEEEEIYDIFNQYGIARTATAEVVKSLKEDEDAWVKVRRTPVLQPE